jgi:hypothetical protein
MADGLTTAGADMPAITWGPRPKVRYVWHDPLPPLTGTNVTMAIGRWVVVVALSAGPSFFFGLYPAGTAVGVAAMLLGLAMVTTAYVAGSLSPWGRRLTRLPFVQTTARIGYGTRMALSASFFTGFSLFPDMMIGAAVGGVLEGTVFPMLNTGSGRATLATPLSHIAQYFVAILIWTLGVALTWNLILGVYMLLIYGLQRLFRRMPVGRPGETCLRCGYDIRMSSETCPECGEPIVHAAEITDRLIHA